MGSPHCALQVSRTISTGLEASLSWPRADGRAQRHRGRCVSLAYAWHVRDTQRDCSRAYLPPHYLAVTLQALLQTTLAAPSVQNMQYRAAATARGSSLRTAPLIRAQQASAQHAAALKQICYSIPDRARTCSDSQGLLCVFVYVYVCERERV